MRFAAVRRVQVPVEVVWRVLLDHEAMSTWAPGVRVTLEREGTGSRGGVGAVRIVRAAGLTIREMVTDAVDERLLGYRCLSGLPLRDYAGEVHLTPNGNGTTVTWVLSTSARSRLVGIPVALYARIFAAALCRAATRVAAGEPTTGARSLAEAFQRTVARDPDGLALSTPDGAITRTWRQYGEQVSRTAAALHAHGVRRGDRVALMMANRPEFYPIDTGALHLGAVPFSIYNTSTATQVRWLVDSARPEVVVCDADHAPRVLAAIDGSSVKYVICVDDGVEGTTGLTAFLDAGASSFDFDAAWRAVEPEDVLTVIYTSGTTGEPKGVQLTHANMLAQVEATNRFLRAGPGDRILSFLPSAHVADRWAAHYLQICCGTTVYPLADRAQLLPAMLQVRPTMFGAVPQVWQKIRAGVLMMIAAEPDADRRAGIERAIELGRAYVRGREAGAVTAALGAAFRAADETVFAPLRAKLGLDAARVVMSGAAPVPVDVVEFFNALGIPLIDGWGMSELSCMGAFTPLDAPRLGSVGKVLPGNEVRLAEDGELLVRGPIVMTGYLGRPDLTAETIDPHGWLRTGDIARIDDDGYLFVVDRKKELLVNSSGKNLSPAAIEGRVKAATPLIAQVAAVGDGRPFVVALVVLDPDAAGQYARSRELTADPAVLAADPGIQAAVAAAIEVANGQVAEVEHIRKYTVLPEFWEPGSDVLTHTMKLRRRPIQARYADLIEALYRLPREQAVLRAGDPS
jgi:long-chain acyl-CoA synthetase